METYTFLRHLADSWVLLILTLIFLGVIFWAFRPGSRRVHDDAAEVPFRHDEKKPDAARPTDGTDTRDGKSGAATDKEREKADG
ncbi:Cbb3-type cytochrome oxidase, subunit 3 [Jannaschia seosinensis]|uniref:Cbb3-type cytochrome oxidase, subunit 3 n=1 Tax=Jannaschia seosinensis TaxID=313367 RepID=A0A0M7B6V2_9RHOB|nr:CcoQ/FixQ family Cbb3-type cytochrome c oxidase assembly chaperone [Jannaschia seosinensis]CUH12882.1 Cbb3-type cytochrome oxidase, subunit 3 [Jannaschia seosinensis]